MKKKRIILASLAVLLLLLIQPPLASNASSDYASSGFNNQFIYGKAGWKILSGKWKVANGYFITKGNKKAINNAYYKNRHFSTLTYEARMRSTGWNIYGLIFRGHPIPLSAQNYWDDGYYFMVNTQVGDPAPGNWTIGYMKKGVYHHIGNAETSKINKKGWNVLKVTANGDYLQFFINGKRVARGTFKVFNNGKVGLLSARDSGKSTFFVDWVTLTTSAPSSVLFDRQMLDQDEILLNMESVIPGSNIFAH